MPVRHKLRLGAFAYFINNLLIIILSIIIDHLYFPLLTSPRCRDWVPDLREANSSDRPCTTPTIFLLFKE